MYSAIKRSGGSLAGGKGLPVLHVEVLLKEEISDTLKTEITTKMKDVLNKKAPDIVVLNDHVLNISQEIYAFDEILTKNVQSVSILADDDSDGNFQDQPVDSTVGVTLGNAELEVYVFYLDPYGVQSENMTDESGESTPAAQHWVLPSAELQNEWENLVFDEPIKSRLLSYVSTALEFDYLGIDSKKISWNRVVLLHGPPGTGKTSLCRAIAQKLSIRLSHSYCYGQLIEINSHSLFSKWFSESGKLVNQMFEKIQEMVDDPEALVCVLIDEVESLTKCRTSASASEPGDAVRVVNALLTALDAIKRHHNVVIFTTSNITGSIDSAFIDRADIKQYVGLPSTSAIYSMLQSSLEELMLKKFLESGVKILPLPSYRIVPDEPSKALMNLCKNCVGLSGRSLKKLPFLAAQHFLTLRKSGTLVPLNSYLAALSKAAVLQHKEQKELTK